MATSPRGGTPPSVDQRAALCEELRTSLPALQALIGDGRPLTVREMADHAAGRPTERRSAMHQRLVVATRAALDAGLIVPAPVDPSVQSRPHPGQEGLAYRLAPHAREAIEVLLERLPGVQDGTRVTRVRALNEVAVLRTLAGSSVQHVLGVLSDGRWHSMSELDAITGAEADKAVERLKSTGLAVVTIVQNGPRQMATVALQPSVVELMDAFDGMPSVLGGPWRRLPPAVRATRIGALSTDQRWNALTALARSATAGGDPIAAGELPISLIRARHALPEFVEMGLAEEAPLPVPRPIGRRGVRFEDRGFRLTSEGAWLMDWLREYGLPPVIEDAPRNITAHHRLAPLLARLAKPAMMDVVSRVAAGQPCGENDIKHLSVLRRAGLVGGSGYADARSVKGMASFLRGLDRVITAVAVEPPRLAAGPDLFG